MKIRRTKGVSYLFFFGGGMRLEEAVRRRRRDGAVLGRDYHLARAYGLRRRFGVSLRLDHYIEDRGKLVPTERNGAVSVTSLELTRAPGSFVHGALLQMTPDELAYMDMFEAVNTERPESGFMKRMDITKRISPLPKDADAVYAYFGTHASRRRCRRAIQAKRAAIPAYYLEEISAAIEELALELHPSDELLQRPSGINVVEMRWHL